MLTNVGKAKYSHGKGSHWKPRAKAVRAKDSHKTCLGHLWSQDLFPYSARHKPQQNRQMTMTRRFYINGQITLELKLIIWMTLAAILSLRAAEAEVAPVTLPTVSGHVQAVQD